MPRTTTVRAPPAEREALWLPKKWTTQVDHPPLISGPPLRRHARDPQRWKSSIITAPLEAGVSSSAWLILATTALRPQWRSTVFQSASAMACRRTAACVVAAPGSRVVQAWRTRWVRSRWGSSLPPAFVREPDGNGCIERFFRTLKEQLLWVRHFQSIPELVRALEQIRALYNQHWLIERLGFEPPVQARQRLALQPAPCAWWSYLSKKSGAVQLEYGGSYLSKKSGAVHNPQIT